MWKAFWAWYVRLFSRVTYHTPAPRRTRRDYAWPVYVHGSFRHHHKVREAQ